MLVSERRYVDPAPASLCDDVCVDLLPQEAQNEADEINLPSACHGALILLLYIRLRCYITITSSLSPSKRTTPIPCLSTLGSFQAKNLPHVLFEMKCEIMLKKPDA